MVATGFKQNLINIEMLKCIHWRTMIIRFRIWRVSNCVRRFCLIDLILLVCVAFSITIWLENIMKVMLIFVCGCELWKLLQTKILWNLITQHEIIYSLLISSSFHSHYKSRKNRVTHKRTTSEWESKMCKRA
jgi:hypothetical protein